MHWITEIGLALFAWTWVMTKYAEIIITVIRGIAHAGEDAPEEDPEDIRENVITDAHGPKQ